MSSPDKLYSLVQDLVKLPQLKYIRFHTRTITTLPGRFKISYRLMLENMVKEFSNKRFSIVLHVNHKSELTTESAEIIKFLSGCGYILLSQSVLLKSINDDAYVLQDLVEKLADLNVKPYYIHQLDPVSGAAHFSVPVDKGRKIMQKLRTLVPVYLLPRYVKDSKQGKVNLSY